METKSTTEQKPFNIYNKVEINFDWKDRLRILFGKSAHCDTTLFVDKEVDILKPSKTHAWVEPIIHSRKKGGIEMFEFEKQSIPTVLGADHVSDDREKFETK